MKRVVKGILGTLGAGAAYACVVTMALQYSGLDLAILAIMGACICGIGFAVFERAGRSVGWYIAVGIGMAVLMVALLLAVAVIGSSSPFGPMIGVMMLIPMAPQAAILGTCAAVGYRVCAGPITD